MSLRTDAQHMRCKSLTQHGVILRSSSNDCSRYTCDLRVLQNHMDIWASHTTLQLSSLKLQTRSSEIFGVNRDQLGTMRTIQYIDHTGERIRDKIAASKRKGMWMGGSVPLGYRVDNRTLQIEPQEAELVQQIFAQFIAEKSTTKIVRELSDRGIQTKRRKAFCKQSIYKILHNRTYIGEISHKGETFPAQHEGLIDKVTWDRVQAILTDDSRLRCRKTWDRKNRNDFLLRGIAYTTGGDLLIPMATRKSSGKVYRYYVINKKLHQGAKAAQSWNYPAQSVEEAVTDKLMEYLRSEQMVHAYWEQIQKINPSIDEPQAVVLLLRRTAEIWNQFFMPMKVEIVRSLIERVVLSPSGIEVIMRYEALGEFVKAMNSNNPSKQREETL